MEKSFVLIYEPKNVFKKCFDDLKTSEELKAYLSSLFYTMIRTPTDNELPKKSIVLSYFDAKIDGDFDKYKRIGDHVTWTATMFPESLSEHYDMSVDIAKSSYYACWRLLRNKWKLYKELGDDLQNVIVEAREAIVTSDIILQNDI